MRPETIAVHGGYSPDPTTKSVAVPIYQTTSYALTARSTAPTCSISRSRATSIRAS
jgi:O-acetylhomoserine/O-acetylserine sulfhydrylase-like pyridoxal-dependent enzyme